MVDVCAQTDVILHKFFVPFIDRTQSIKKITDIFKKKDVNDWKKKMEPLREVH